MDIVMENPFKKFSVLIETFGQTFSDYLLQKENILGCHQFFFADTLARL